GIGYDEVKNALADIGDDIYIANYNSPIQIVIAGSFAAIEAAEKVMDDAGAMRYVKLKVSGPFHTPLMEEARKNFEKEISGFSFHNPVLRLYSNVTGGIIEDGEMARKLAVSQIVSPVLWVSEEQEILDEGYDNILEVGPGTVLRGLWKSFNKEIKCRPAGKTVDIDALSE
ncbi:MAG: ACP S-malonyltransferase, partial [Spirochaetales bacterium]|nr:ACP S-malonyltransferase [Spirochaetales bacterium]